MSNIEHHHNLTDSLENLWYLYFHHVYSCIFHTLNEIILKEFKHDKICYSSKYHDGTIEVTCCTSTSISLSGLPSGSSTGSLLGSCSGFSSGFHIGSVISFPITYEFWGMKVIAWNEARIRKNNYWWHVIDKYYKHFMI